MGKKLYCATVIMGLAMAASFTANASVTSEATDIKTSECLNSYYDRPDTRAFYDGPQEYQISYNDGLLTVTWNGIEGNCCPVKWIVEVVKDADNLKFFAYDVDGMCDCLCPYNLTATFTDIEAGEYEVVFTNIYGDEIAQKVNISQGLDITVKQTPTGVADIKSGNRMMSISSDGLLHVDSESDSIVEIYNTDGVMMAKLNVTPHSDIDIKTLDKGIYIAKIKSDDKKDSIIFAR